MKGHVSELLKEEREPDLRRTDRKLLNELDVRPLEYVWALLRERRAGFDRLPREEQFALMKRAFVYVNGVVSNLRKLLKFLEYGTPGGLPTRTLETADKSVQAAVLRDVVGLSLRRWQRSSAYPSLPTSTRRETCRRRGTSPTGDAPCWRRPWARRAGGSGPRP
jgi:hypothetical protein